MELPLLEELSLCEMQSISLAPLGELNSEHRLTSLVLDNIANLNLASLANGALPSLLKRLAVKGCVLRWVGVKSPSTMFMTSFKKLECLSFENTSANRGFKKFEFPSHDSLHSRCTPWRWPDMHQLARCSQLCELDVDFRHIGPEQAIAALQNLVKLRRLIVSGARIHDVLEALSSLQSLQCGRNTDWRSKTSSASSECKLLDIQPHSALRSIELEHTTWYRFLPYLVPNLQHIYIYIDDVIPSVSELLAWRHLVSLRLHVVDIDLPNGYVRRLLKGLPHLVTLNIVVGYFPWQDKLQVERPMLPKLTELVLRKCRCFTVEAILGLQGLTWLDITGWGKVEYLALLKRSNGLGRWVAEAY